MINKNTLGFIKIFTRMLKSLECPENKKLVVNVTLGPRITRFSALSSNHPAMVLSLE